MREHPGAQRGFGYADGAEQSAARARARDEACTKDPSFELKPLDNHFFMPRQKGRQDTSGGYAGYDLAKARRPYWTATSSRTSAGRLPEDRRAAEAVGRRRGRRMDHTS
ncbi:hypothetical protein M878_14485 [Streptomyces roseochromogenus subsp. oscitans DS 12.976]|uniref:Uncharacterized protein n=1 Tax=Streptomyces roseochromogenus subsp. oscitans DS 12.976 TaxID=1352936 RepID=V6KMM0_STRRC|nr:hypothetical protein M878_14485 [Streptomyces roseochromogenus subsp. oscitans DS 12.976]